MGFGGATPATTVSGLSHPPGHCVGIHPEQAPVGVEQVLLVGDELIAYLDVVLTNGLLSCRRPRYRNRCGQDGQNQKDSHTSFHSLSPYPPSPLPAGEAEAVTD